MSDNCHPKLKTCKKKTHFVDNIYDIRLQIYNENIPAVKKVALQSVEAQNLL
jgi:hypothetical protein